MSVFYNVLGSQNIAGSIQQDQFYAFTSDTNLNNVRADVTVSLLSWTTGIRTSATDFLTLSRANMQISSDFYSGSEKIDTIFGSNLNDAVLYNNGVISGGFGSFSSIEQIELGAGDDIVDLTAHGTGGLDYGKNITIRAGNGDDIIIGGAGLDTLYGDDGNDLIFGYRGADIIYGGTGDDRLYGDDLGFNGIAGADFLYGEAGDDFLDGGARGDFLSGGEGNDILIGGGGDDSLFGDVGIDTFVFSGNRSDYSIFWDAFNSPYRVTDLRPGSPDGADNVSGAEFLQFADGTIALTGPNNHPVITSNGGGITASIAINENSTSVTTVFATDVDSGQTVTYSILGGPDAALFEINQVTGELSFINAPDFESPADIGMDNVYNLIVQASDGINSDQQQIAVSVGNANESPVITSNGGGATASVNVAENTAAITTVTSTDADGPAPVYTIVGGADAALFTIDPQTGALQFLSAPNFENPSDLNRDNAYDVIVRASDGTDFDQQQITVIVNNVNEFAPQIVSNGGASTASIGVLENINLATTVTAFDIDRGTLTYSIAGGADASLFAIDSVTGALAFISAPDFENPLDAGLDNIYEIIVRASDGELYDEQVLSITIRDVSEVGGVTIVATSGNNTISPTATQFRTTAGNDTIFALAGDDIIDGGAGADRMEGGSGNDVYYVDQFSDDGNSANDDLVIEAAAAGTDRVFSTVSYVLTSNVEELFLQGLNSINGTGNELANKIIGNAGNNVLDGGLGNDTFLGFDGDDILLGGVGNDLLDGGGGYNVLDGGDGNDTLDGRDGVNRLLGGFGDDIYYINDTTDDGDNTNDDLVTEAASAGIDLVYSQWDYVLPANVENLTLLEGLTNNGWGNDLNNLINGNSGNNYLDGGLGNDTLLGNDGADTLSGGSGDDILVGGLGADSHEGGSGNDTYFIDVFSDDGISYNDDKVIELAGGGIDTVNASVNYTLGNEVENLTLTGTLAINGTGTALANTLIGNSAANTILGLDGNDTINGNAGDDVLRGGNGNDTMNGGTENDTLFGDAGTDTLLGGAGNDIIAGGSGSDTLNGQSGLDTLIGGTGRDSMNGGTEADIFKFAFGDTTKVSSTIDVITDFTTGSDKVDLDFVAGGISAASYSEGLITTNSFTEALASAQAMLSGGKSVAFVAGSADGWLFWDTNSDGVIDQSILLKGVTSLGGFDFTDIM